MTRGGGMARGGGAMDMEGRPRHAAAMADPAKPATYNRPQRSAESREHDYTHGGPHEAAAAAAARHATAPGAGGGGSR